MKNEKWFMANKYYRSDKIVVHFYLKNLNHWSSRNLEINFGIVSEFDIFP